RVVVGREVALHLVAPDDADQLDPAARLPGNAGLWIFLLRRDEAAVEQHDGAVVGAQRRDDLDADIVLQAARGEIVFLVVEQRAGDADAAVLAAQRVDRKSV